MLWFFMVRDTLGVRGDRKFINQYLKPCTENSFGHELKIILTLKLKKESHIRNNIKIKNCKSHVRYREDNCCRNMEGS